MEANIILRKEDLNLEFIEKIKSIFKKSDKLQIVISEVEDFELHKKESSEEYFSRLELAAKNVEKNKVTFTDAEFLELIKDKL
jgi:hypothetical protein